MTVIAINGSPRKGWSTHMLLEKALEGAASKGAKTEIVNLYDIDFKGCLGCLGCKRKGGTVGRCVINDALKPVLDKVAECDALILGSPVYIGEATGEMRSFLERLIFQYISYDKMGDILFGKSIKTAFLFTTNCPENMYEAVGYTRLFSDYDKLLIRIFGECKTLASSETWQIDDYENYHMAMFDVPARKQRRTNVFPEDLGKAFAIGEWATTSR